MWEERNSSKYDNSCSKELALLHFLPFFSADKSAPRVKLETLGTSVKTIYCCPCPDTPVSCSPLVCAETPPIAQWFVLSFLSFVTHFAFSCPALTQLLSAHQTEPTRPCSPRGPWYTWYRFLTSPEPSDTPQILNAMRLVTGFPFLFSCSSYLSVFLFSQENFPQDDITSERLPQWPWPR